jgi:protein-tyrosine sulfotransferase
LSVLGKIGLGFGRSRRGFIQRFKDESYPRPDDVEISADALATARIMRGTHPPAIMIYGVAQRSGTVFTGELLRLHPDVCAYPRELYEVPFLNLAARIRRLQKDFLAAYKHNRKGIGKDDFLPLFGASFIGFINRAVPQGQRALLKIPDARQLAYLPHVFPFELPLFLLRDGRDLVESTVKTWPEVPFYAACRRWNLNTRIMLEQQKAHAHEGREIFRYEEAIARPRDFVERLCRHCQLDVGRYPFEMLDEIHVRGSSNLKQHGSVTWEPLEKPEGFNPIGRWRNWSARQKRIFKRICGQTLIESGYVTDSNW